MKTDRSSVQVRKVLTYVRVRDKLRNQPRLKNHQAHRNSKRSKQPKARKTGPPPHYVYCWMPQELAVMTYSQSYQQSPGSARRGTLSQPSHLSLQVSNEHSPMGLCRLGHAEVSETDKIIAMNTCRTTRRKSIKHRPELQWAYGKLWRLTRSGVRRYRWSHR